MRRDMTWGFGPFQRLFDTPGDPGGGGGTGGGAPAGSPAPAAAPPAGGAPAGGGGAPAGGDPAAAATPRFTYQEDRSDWMPRHRYNEINGRLTQLQTNFDQQQQRVRALMGVAEPANPRHAEIRQALTEIAPELAPLFKNPQAFAKVLEMVEGGQLDTLSEGTSAQWNRHAFQMSQSAVDAWAKANNLEADKIPQRAQARLASQMREFIEEDQTGVRLRRYEMGDPGLVHEFIADLQGFWVAPVRPAQNAAGALLTDRNRRLPSQGPRGGVPAGGAVPPKLTREEKSKAAREFMAQGQQ